MVKFERARELEKLASPYFDMAYRKVWNIKEIKVIKDDEYGISNEVDKILVLEDGTEIMIEEKIRDSKYAGNDIVIEEQSNVEKGTQGWIYYSKADYLAYSWFLCDKVLLFDMKKLREWYIKNKDRYEIVTTNTDRLYHTSFRVIPIKDIDFSYKEINIEISSSLSDFM